MDIFSGPKIFKSGSAVSPHRVLSNEVSHDPILIKNFFSKIWYIYIYIYISRPRTKAKKLEVRNFFRKKLFSGNDLKWSKMYFKAKKIFLKIFGPLKIAIFGQNLKFLAKNGHFRTPRAIFFGRPKKIFDSIIFCAHLERHFELSYAPIPQCMWSG